MSYSTLPVSVKRIRPYFGCSLTAMPVDPTNAHRSRFAFGMTKRPDPGATVRIFWTTMYCTYQTDTNLSFRKRALYTASHEETVLESDSCKLDPG